MCVLTWLNVMYAVAVDAGDGRSSTVETQHNDADTSVLLIDDDDDDKGAKN